MAISNPQSDFVLPFLPGNAKPCPRTAPGRKNLMPYPHCSWTANSSPYQRSGTIPHALPIPRFREPSTRAHAKMNDIRRRLDA